MGLIKKAVGLVWLTLLPSLLFAGIEDIEIDLEIINPGAQVFVVGDFRSNLAVTSFFILHLANNGDTPVHMRLEAEIKYNGVQIARGNSNPITFPGQQPPPGPPPLVYGNQQLMIGALLPWGETLTLDQFDIDLNAVENLENQILATGALPAGTYEFLMRAVEEGTGVIKPDNQQNHTLVITNPTTLELLFPGHSVSENTIEEIATAFPYFQWHSDGNPGTGNYNIFVYEKYPEDATVQAVLNHPPMLQIEGYTFNFLQYPLSSDPGGLLSGQVIGPLRQLEPGKIYYWLVQSVIPTGTGNLSITSEVFRFKISNLAGSANYAPQILALLEQILGPNYWPVLQQLRDSGFEPNGTIFLEQSAVEISDLLLILGKLNRGEMEVKDVDVY